MSLYKDHPDSRVFLIDASIYIFRAWYIYPDTIVDSENRPINALYGFLYFLSDFLANASPRHIAIAFDSSIKENFRKRLYPPYKANRDPAPDELKYQFGLCQQVASDLGINCLTSDSFEADDLIATMANRYKQMDYGITIVSADKDLAQIMKDEQDFLWDYARSEVYDQQGIVDKFGVKPDRIPDLLALAGDKVDNIPGANGVGVKTAASLLKQFSCLEDILANTDKIRDCKIRNSAHITQSINDDIDLIRVYYQLTELIEMAQMNETGSCEWQCPEAITIDEILVSYSVDNILRSRFSRIAATET